MKFKVTSETTAMAESESQKEQDGSPVWYQVNIDANTCTCTAGRFGKPCKHVPLSQQAIILRYSEQWKDHQVVYVEIHKGHIPGVILQCSKCKGEAYYTEEGPNDEYPDILCERCESS